jgi:hypothetical protein
MRNDDDTLTPPRMIEEVLVDIELSTVERHIAERLTFDLDKVPAMKWVCYITLLSFMVVQQLTCHASPAYVMYVVSWPPTLVACLLVELVVYGVLLHTETTEDDRVRRALSWTLYGIALATPAWPAWGPVLGALGGVLERIS